MMKDHEKKNEVWRSPSLVRKPDVSSWLMAYLSLSLPFLQIFMLLLLLSSILLLLPSLVFSVFAGVSGGSTPRPQRRRRHKRFDVRSRLQLSVKKVVFPRSQHHLCLRSNRERNRLFRRERLIPALLPPPPPACGYFGL